MSLTKSLGRTVLAASLAIAGLAIAQPAAASDALSLEEVKTAATAKFAKLDSDSDGSLEPGEMKGVLGDKAFSAADTDGDGKLEKAEYLVLVEKYFKRADVDHDSSVDAKELNGPNGKMLKRLIR